MADASCSGTTPYKQLIDHQNRNSSHHQDRLVGQPQLGAQGSFRSAAAPIHHVQQDFSAFMDGAGPMPHDPAGRLAAHTAALDPMQAPRFGTPPIFAQQHPSHVGGEATPDMSGWATDFSRFNQQRASPSPAPQGMLPQQPTFQPGMMNQASPYQGFANAFAPQASAMAPMYGMANGAFANPAATAQQPAAQADFDQEMARWMTANGGGDMSHVDAAMDQMARELELSEATLVEAEKAAEHEASGALQTDNTHFTDLETPEIGNLSLEQQPAQEIEELADQQESKERSAVAEAAEQLLDTVQHEQGEKWQNSVFLSLMRDFRDGKKDIVDGEITKNEPENGTQGTNTPTGSDGGRLVTDFQKYHPYAISLR